MDSLEEECVLVLQILFTLRPTLPLSFLFSLCVLCKKSIDDWNVYLTCSLWGLSLSTVGSPRPGPKYQQQVLWAESLSGSIYWNFHFSKVFASQKKIFFRWDLLYKFHIAKRGVSLSVFHLFLLSHSSLQMRLKKKKKKRWCMFCDRHLKFFALNYFGIRCWSSYPLRTVRKLQKLLDTPLSDANVGRAYWQLRIFCPAPTE